MKLVSVGEPGSEVAGLLVSGERVLPVAELRPAWPRDWSKILEAGLWRELPALAVAAEIRVAQSTSVLLPARTAEERSMPGRVRLGPPVTDPSKIIAIGLNYRDHALEQKKEPPKVPLLFAKAPSCLIGPHDPIRLPPEEVEDQVDTEGELCVVLKREARNVPESKVLDYVLGYTIMNDVSGRRAQYGDRQWFRGKSFDTFGPCGPWVVTTDELPDPSGLALETDWGDTAMQRGNTRDLIHGVPALVSYISRQMTLKPGDLITTGTPAGVGVYRDPQVFLERGITVTVRLENVGELRNPIV